jgi:hypothetical protein
MKIKTTARHVKMNTTEPSNQISILPPPKENSAASPVPPTVYALMPENVINAAKLIPLNKQLMPLNVLYVILNTKITIV